MFLVLLACSGPEPVTPTPPPTPPTPTPPPAVTITPTDIPTGFNYPGDRATLQGWADAWQTTEITGHGWDLWAGMTADSGQKWNGAALPYWETWCGTEDVATGCGPRTSLGRTFKKARQISHAAQLLGQTPKNDTEVVSFNRFNPAMSDYLENKAHAGPGGTYDYTSMKSLVALNNAWPTGTPIADRKVEETPYVPDAGTTHGYAAIETKPVIYVVKKTGLTPLPLWQGTAQSTVPANAVPETWKTCVAVDPANTGGPDTAPVPATPEQIAAAQLNNPVVNGAPSLACETWLYAPLSTIYAFAMDAGEASAWNKLVNASGDGGQNLTAEAGDFGVLMGMHTNTKEIVNWTWQTFWWQPGADAPDNFPGSKAGMTQNVTGAWRNYAMCTAWNQTEGNASSTMVTCFNPFLETSADIPAGQTSNCMTCHGTATAGAPTGTPPSLGTLNYPASYAKPIDFNTDPMYATYTRTDFSWAIPGNATNDLPQ